MYLSAQTLISVSHIQATKCILILKARICRECPVCFGILTPNITSQFDNSFCVSDTINSLLTLCGAEFVRIQQSVTSANNSLPVTGNCRHYRVYKPLPINPVLSPPDPIHIFTFLIFRAYGIYQQIWYGYFSMTHQPLVSEGLLINEASRSHSDAPQSVGLHWTSDCPLQRPLTDNTQCPQETYPCPRRDWNLQSQEARGLRPTPWTARQLGSACYCLDQLVVQILIKLLEDVICQNVSSHFYYYHTVELQVCFMLHVLVNVNPLKPELNAICYLLALLAHHFLHVSRIRVKSLTFRRLMSYIYREHPFLMFLDHIQRRSTVGRTPLDE